MNLSEKIKLIRQSDGLSQSKLAKRINIPLNTIGNYETGTRKVSAEYLLKLSEVFPQFSLWLLTGSIAPEVGQISPDQEVPQIMSVGVPKELIDDAFDKTIETSVALGWLAPKEGIEFSMLADLHRHNFVEAGGVLLEPESTQESKTG